QVGVGKRELLAVEVEHGPAVDGAGVGRQPAGPDRAGRVHDAGRGVEHDVVAGATVEGVVSGSADEHVVARAAGQHVVTRAAQDYVVAVTAVQGEWNRAGSD